MSATLPHRFGMPRARPDGFPALDRIGLRLAHGLRDAFASLGSTVSLTPEPAVNVRFGDWKARLPECIAVARYRTTNLRGGVMLSIPRALVGGMVDAYYGGTGIAESVARVGLSAAERRFLDRLVDDARATIAASWSDLARIDPELLCIAFTPADVPPVRADDEVVVQRFAIDKAAALELVYPAAALHALPALRAPGADEREAEDAHDPVWRARLSDAVMQSRLRVRTVIARPTMPLDRLMALVPGDIIPVCLPAHIPVTVAGRLLAHGTIGEANGRAAIKISKIEHGGVFND